MTGITFNELYDYLSGNHEIEFTYQNTTYVLQPEVCKGKSYIVIWTYPPNAKCVFRREIPKDGEIPKRFIDDALNAKCLEGKSFLEVEKDIHVEAVQ